MPRLSAGYREKCIHSGIDAARYASHLARAVAEQSDIAELELWCAADEEEDEEVRQPVDPEPSFVASGAGNHTSSSRTVTVALFLACLRVTFIFEHHLMELRRACFDKSKRCALSPEPLSPELCQSCASRCG